MSGNPGLDLTAVVHARVSPKGVLDNLSQQEVDKLLEWIAGGSSTPQVQMEGEHLFATERLVVSPAAGVIDEVP